MPTTVSVESPMSATDHVQTIAIFNALNPQRDVRCSASGWSHTIDVIVTLAACIEA